MPANSPSPLLKAYYWYLSLRLPWRRKYLIGADLSSNLYWELSPSYALSARARRLVSSGTRGAHVADLQISPQWHQWLRHVRAEPPSWEELLADRERRRVLDGRVREVERRWGEGGRGEEGAKKPGPAGEWSPGAWVPGKRGS